MKKFVPLLLCLALSIFTVARAAKPVPDTKTSREKPTVQKADANDASDDEGEDINDDDGSNAGADENADDDGGGDDDEVDDGGGNEGE